MKCDENEQVIGIIGLGEMGLPMARNLISGGFSVTGFDLRQEALDELVQAKGRAAKSPFDVVQDCDVVLTSLPSSEAFVKVATEFLVPKARDGQIFIETGTTIPYQLQGIAEQFSKRGATLLDVPVSGGAVGVQKMDLNMFGGGDESTFERCRPIFAAIGGPDRIHYCGPSGSGQKMKGVNQLKMGLINAAAIEILAFARQCDLDLSLMEKVFPDANWQMVTSLASEVLEGKGNEIGVKFRELPYYLEQARQEGFRLPITKAVHACCDQGKRVTIDDHRSAPSYWHELTKDKNNSNR